MGEQTTPITETEDSLTPTDEALPKRYYAQFWKKVQPAEARFDELAGTIYWSDAKQEILVEGLNNKYSSDIEAFFGSNLTLPHGVFVSYAETPKEWVRNLHLAELTNNFYAVQFMESIDETE